MNVIPLFRSRRADALRAAARWAAVSVPGHLSARGLAVPTAAVLLLPLAVLLPLVLPWASVWLAPLFLLAAALRLAALVNLALPKAPEPPPLADADLPSLTVLLPLYREAAVVPDLVAAMGRLDYPRHLVEFVVLLEADDPETPTAAARAAPPSGWRIVTCPPGEPKTKPRAVNIGLALTSGEVVVIYDGEDRPEPDQARRAVAALLADPRRAVVQCALAADHGGPWFTRCWASEYNVLFGAILPVLSRLGLPFLLGGTSQFIRRDALMAAGAYCAHNVTEDADLGVRLARLGWTSAAIPSVTWEEAPVTLRAFLQQRRRWIAGHIITALVHLRRPAQTWRDLGPAGSLALLAQLPAATASTAAHPLGLALLLGGDATGWLGLLLGLGYAAALSLYWARGGSVFLLPAFWLLQTAALALALHDVVRQPCRWFKTAHGVAERRAMPPPDSSVG
ncbi:glycosyltransferase family 2 protein [Roseinatronobacter sp. NSM]|uniref:glycosyltransferase family 2 protein n=1 Tax=Roseinatronobacter sp. NSM TaxID=3457785 RepID=UPI00403754EC